MREGYPAIHETLHNHERRADDNFLDTLEVPELEEGDELVPTNLDVDFEELYRQKHLLENELGLVENLKKGTKVVTREKAGQFDSTLHELNETQLKNLYEMIFARIERETNYFHQLEELDIMDNIVENKLEDWGGLRRIGGANIKWESSRPQSRGVYNWRTNIASVKKSRPRMFETLQSLAVDGRLPDSLRTLTHEVTHGKHFPALGKGLLSEFYYRLTHWMNDQGLEEIYANRSANRSMDVSTKLSLINRLRNKTDCFGNPLYARECDDVNVKNWSEAVIVIDQLEALGFTTDKIGELVKDYYFPNGKDSIKKVIETKMQELGLDEGDLENLVQAHRVEAEINRLKVMKIVQEELERIN